MIKSMHVNSLNNIFEIAELITDLVVSKHGIEQIFDNKSRTSIVFGEWSVQIKPHKGIDSDFDISLFYNKMKVFKLMNYRTKRYALYHCITRVLVITTNISICISRDLLNELSEVEKIMVDEFSIDKNTINDFVSNVAKLKKSFIVKTHITQAGQL